MSSNSHCVHVTLKKSFLFAFCVCVCVCVVPAKTMRLVCMKLYLFKRKIESSVKPNESLLFLILHVYNDDLFSFDA